MSSPIRNHPNVIVILTDDQGYWAMGCAGNSEIRTPNLDRLAGSGIRFENMFCVSPVCSAARASLLTGRIPSAHGVHDWIAAGNSSVEQARGGELVEYLDGIPGYSDILANNGYTCGISGKWHLGDAHHAQKGFSFWEVHAQGGGPYHNWPRIKDGDVVREQRYVTDVITEDALAFLQQQDRDNPFYLSVHYTAPHSPWEREHHPHELWDDYYENCPFESTPDMPLHPWQIKGFTDMERSNRRDMLAGYFTAITAMDTGVGRILDWLEENNLREDTLIFFTSDNGMSMGHHGVYGKGNGTYPMNMYDTAVKVPGILSQPGTLRENTTEDALVSHYDFMPTLLDCLGMELPHANTLPGHSFAPLLREGGSAIRETVVVYDEYGPVRMIRSREWKYIHRFPDGPHELYHLADDPEETRNLIDDPAHTGTREALRTLLGEWFRTYVDPGLDGSILPVTGSGQFARCCEDEAFGGIPALMHEEHT